jgi:hypothetical protein
MDVYGIINTTQMRIETVMTRCKKVHYSSHKMNSQLVNRINVYVFVCLCVCVHHTESAVQKQSIRSHI